MIPSPDGCYRAANGFHAERSATLDDGAFRALGWAPLTRNPIKRKLAAFDTENWQADGPGHRKGDFRLGVIHAGDTRVFQTREAMRAAFLERRYDGCYFYAHNLAYDLQNIWGHEFPGKLCVINGQVYFGKMKAREWTVEVRQYGRRVTKKRRTYVRFADTTRHQPGTLKRLAKELGRTKLFADRDDLDSLTETEIEARCVEDTLIVWEFITAGQETLNELGTSLNFTVGSSVLELFRRTGLDRTYYQLDRSFLLELNQAYYGGRCEAFQVGILPVGDYYYGDVVSMYPSVMRELELPVATRESVYRSDSPETWMLARPGASLVRLLVPDMAYPPLPYKKHGTGKLLFPCGVLTGWWPHNELRYAIDECGVQLLDMHRSIWFDQSCTPFRGMIDKLFAVRERGGIWKEWAKRLMNNGYGKMGQCRPPGELLTPEDYLDLRLGCATSKELDELADITTEFRDNDDRLIAVMIQSKDKVFPIHANQVWAAMITAGARIRLHRELVKYQALYCDTDSIVTRMKIVPDRRLGALDLKMVIRSDADDPALIAGPKAYRFRAVDAIDPDTGEVREEKMVRVKGVPARRGWRQGDDGLWYRCSDIQREALIGTPVMFDAPMKMLEGLRKTNVPSLLPIPTLTETSGFTLGPIGRAFPNVWFPHIKKLRLENDKRQVLPSGETKPLWIGSVGNVHGTEETQEAGKARRVPEMRHGVRKS